MRSPRALAALVVLTLIWGYSWVLAKQALDYAAPFTLGFLRSLVSTFALFGVLMATRRSLAPRAVLKTGVIGAIQSGLFLVCQTWALVEGGAGRTSVLIFTMPIWTLLLGRFLLAERVRGAEWLAAGSALTGLVVFIAPWNLEASAFSKLLALGAALCWAVGTVLVKRWRAELGSDLLSLTAWQMAAGTLLLAAVVAAVPEPATRWTWPFVAILAFIALVSTALGWILWLRVLRDLPAWQAGLSVLGVPVVANLSSRFALGETVAPLELAGMLLIGAGLALMSFLNWRAQRRAEAVAAA
ncbi:MAG: EamA family transporter [Rhodocyclaceae bacterium]|nr:EamA family transporter [Rhodocyclaceae bacterium]